MCGRYLDKQHFRAAKQADHRFAGKRAPRASPGMSCALGQALRMSVHPLCGRLCAYISYSTASPVGESAGVGGCRGFPGPLSGVWFSQSASRRESAGVWLSGELAGVWLPSRRVGGSRRVSGFPASRRVSGFPVALFRVRESAGVWLPRSASRRVSGFLASPVGESGDPASGVGGCLAFWPARRLDVRKAIVGLKTNGQGRHREGTPRPREIELTPFSSPGTFPGEPDTILARRGPSPASPEPSQSGE